MKKDEFGKFSKEYKVNESFFNRIDTEEKAYILGFFYADGTNMYFNNQLLGISFTQLEQDVNILNKIKNALESDHVFYEVEQDTNGKIKYKYSIYNKILSKNYQI